MFSCVFYLLIYIISIGMVHRSSHSEVFCKIGVLRPATLLKKDLSQVLYCEFCEIFKNNLFIEHP